MVASIVSKKNDAPCDPYPRSIMDWTGGLYASIFDRMGEPNVRLRENDYVIEDKKIGGNAQSIALDTWIHHTSFLWDFDDKDMRYLAMPEKKPDYRGDRPHSSFITRLGPKLGAGLGDARRDAAERLAAELATELGEFYNVQDRLSSQDAEAVVSPDWQGRTKILDPATL